MTQEINPSYGLHFVIAGPDPAIHASDRARCDIAALMSESHFSMDRRVKPGGDEGKGQRAGV